MNVGREVKEKRDEKQDENLPDQINVPWFTV